MVSKDKSTPHTHIPIPSNPPSPTHSHPGHPDFIPYFQKVIFKESVVDLFVLGRVRHFFNFLDSKCHAEWLSWYLDLKHKTDPYDDSCTTHALPHGFLVVVEKSLHIAASEGVLRKLHSSEVHEWQGSQRRQSLSYITALIQSHIQHKTRIRISCGIILVGLPPGCCTRTLSFPTYHNCGWLLPPLVTSSCDCKTP